MSRSKDTQPDSSAVVHPEFAARGSFAHLPLGRIAALHDERTLKLARYLDDEVLLPEIPATFDLVPQVPAWPMYGNDSLGDCTIASVGHMIQAWSAAVGRPITPDEAAIIAAYWETGSSDTGRFEVDVLNFWRHQGIAGDKILAYAYVDPQNLDHVRAALYLCGGLYTGIALPTSAQSQATWDVVGDGKTGDSQPGSWGGHAVPYLPRWNGSTVPLVTWGHVLDATLPFHLAYCDELYAPISPDFLTEGKTPAGFEVDALLADVAQIGTIQADAAAASPADEAEADDEQPDAFPGSVENVDVEEARQQVDGGDPGYYWNG